MTYTQTLHTNILITSPQTREESPTSLHSLNAYVLGLGLLVFGLSHIGLESVNANPANHNAGSMSWMTLQPNPGNLAITLENTSENKHVGNVNIEPTTNHLTIGLEGQIQADQEEFGVNQNGIPEVVLASDHYGQSFLHWGTVFLDGMEVKGTEILASQPYQPAYWLHSIEWTMQSSSHAPFLVPLDSIKDGSADIRLRPVEEFNNLVDTWVQDGGSRLQYLRQDHEFTVMRPVSLNGTVIDPVAFNPEGGPAVEGAGYHTEMMPITVKYIGDPDLIADPVDNGRNPGDEAVPFQVTSASVVTQLYDLNYEGQCPTDLDFGLTINAIGQGTVEYRLVDKLGAKGPISSVWFESGGSHFEIFSKPVTDGTPVDGPGGVLAPNDDHDGVVDDYVTAEVDQQNGSWRVEIVSPNILTSQEHFYHWTCTTTLNERG